MEVNIQHIQNLLNQTNAIVRKYDQIAEISGEKFNVFSILGLQDNETRLHSKLINELLNPKGRHGKKDLFLKLFIEIVNEKIDNKNSLETEGNQTIETIEKDEEIKSDTKNISSQRIDNFNTKNAKSQPERRLCLRSTK